MNQDVSLKFRLWVIVVISCFVLLASCDTVAQPGVATNTLDSQNAIAPTAQREADATSSNPTVTTTVPSTATIQLTPTQTTTEKSAIQSIPSTPVNVTLSATFTTLPTSTYTPMPFPTTATIACNDADISSLPDKVSPTEIRIRNGNDHIAFDGSLMYLAVDRYIGIFDISEPAYPLFWGFWELPELDEISGIKVQEGIAYITGKFSLHLHNLSAECRFAPIATADVPLQIFHLEIEASRLYVGGVLKNQELEQDQVAVLSIAIPDMPEVLGFVDFGQEPTAWSVAKDKIYSLGSEWTITDVSNMDAVHTYPMNVEIDTEILSNSWIRIISDTIYLFSWEDGVWVIDNLEKSSPSINHNSDTYIMMGIFDVQDDYIFIGDSGGCDGMGCDVGSRVMILSADTGEPLSTFVFDPHTSVYKYQVVQDSFVYAFSEKWMYVVDISDINNPIITSRVLLIT